MPKNTIAQRKFKPLPEEEVQGAVPMAPVEIIEALKAYKQQNPAKYEAKKEALFARYGLTVAVEPQLEEVPDANDLELEALKEVEVKKNKKAK